MSENDSVRLDVWLDVACLFRSRSQAQRACKLGRVLVNGENSKPHRVVRVGDRIRLSHPGGHRRIVEVTEIVSTHVPRARARELYIDHTPPPSAEELELRKMQRLAAPPRRPRGFGAPKKKERRELRRLKDWSEN
jgi:ribosome-associated heat shock protein Hsp15